MKILKKILISLILISSLMIFINLNQNVIFASSSGDFITETNTKAKKFLNKGMKEASGTSDVMDAVATNFTGIGQLLTFIGAGVMVAVVSYMGIKYMVSPPDKQAALKQQLIGVVVSGVVIFGSVGIWTALVKILAAATAK